MDEIPACFSTCKTTLKKASCDTSIGSPQYMTQSEQEVFDFDAIKGKYVSECIPHIRLAPASNDALWLDKNHMVFIEFKNGVIDGRLNNEIIRKVYDSILMLMDEKLDISWWRSDYLPNISYMRKHMDYILVYNESKFNSSSLTRQTTKGCDRQGDLQNSPNRAKLYRSLRHLAGRDLILFGLDRFQGYLFRRVHTMNQTDFKEYMDRGGKTAYEEKI